MTRLEPRFVIVLLLVLFAFLGLAADDDADEGSIEDIKKIRLRNGTDANPEMQDFVGGVYEGKAGSYWISGNNIFTPDGQCIRRLATTTSPRKATTARSATPILSRMGQERLSVPETPSLGTARPPSNPARTTSRMEPQAERLGMPCSRPIWERPPRARCS